MGGEIVTVSEGVQELGRGIGPESFQRRDGAITSGSTRTSWVKGPMPWARRWMRGLCSYRAGGRRRARGVEEIEAVSEAAGCPMSFGRSRRLWLHTASRPVSGKGLLYGSQAS